MIGLDLELERFDLSLENRRRTQNARLHRGGDGDGGGGLRDQGRDDHAGGRR